ncbi:hypothetical protein [Halorhabdus amylolytica]|uniref:hypothetical protein n=1 Tax=Halorhabdus amylolytica TaxID=2559573 RepID=UPI0010A9B799|nr:hypothetical protein [Halorhabdus amylolytica]
MTRTTKIKDDLGDVSEEVLSELTPDERLQLFIQASAEHREDRLEQLAETAPTKTYEMTEVEFAKGMRQTKLLSLTARHQIQTRYAELDLNLARRDRYLALFLLNGALDELRDGISIDEYGNVTTNSEMDADGSPSPSTGVKALADEYRDLWDDVSTDPLLSESERDRDLFAELAASGLLGYPKDISGSEFEDLDGSRIFSEVWRTELKLVKAASDFYRVFIAWQIFAEEHVGVSLDEFLGVTDLEDDGKVGRETFEIDEELCENMLELHSDYVDAYEGFPEELPGDGEDANLDAEARTRAEQMIAMSELPV